MGRSARCGEPNALLEDLIRRCGVSRKRLALRVNQLAAGHGRHTSYNHTSVANWTRRGVRPDPAIRPLVAQAIAERLGRPVSLADIGLPMDDGGPASAGLDFPRGLPEVITAATEYWSVVDRRDFLMAASTAGLSTAAWTTPLRRWLTQPADPHAAHDASSRQVGLSDVADLLAFADNARRWDRRLGGGHWRSSTILDCLRLRAEPLLRGRYSDQTGQALFTAAAQVVHVAGWTAFDAGHHTVAQRHYIQALRMARAAGDLPLGGYILTCAALQATLRGHHDDAIDMCQGAYERVKHIATPRTLAFYRLIEARAHGHAQDARAASRALAASVTLLDRAADNATDDPPWIDFCTPNRFANDAIEIHRDLRMPSQAMRWSAQTPMPADTFTRVHGLRLVTLAGTYLLGPYPDLEAAIDHGSRGVDVLTQVSSARAIDYAKDLVHRLRPWRSEPAVIHLTHRILTELSAA